MEGQEPQFYQPRYRRWACVSSLRCTLTLQKDMNAIMTIPQCSGAASYGLEGNLLDGFRIRVAPHNEFEGTPHDCGLSDARVFNLTKTSEGLSLLNKEWGILKRVQ